MVLLHQSRSSDKKKRFDLVMIVCTSSRHSIAGVSKIKTCTCINWLLWLRNNWLILCSGVLLIDFCVSRKRKRRYLCRVMYVLFLYDYINNWYTIHFYATAYEDALKKIRVQNKSGSKLLRKIWGFPCKGIFAVLWNRLYKKFENIPGMSCHIHTDYVERIKSKIMMDWFITMNSETIHKW